MLSACSTPDYTQSQLAALYQKQLQSTQTSLQDIFSHISKDTQSSTQLQLTLPSDSIQGTINYQSIKSTKEKAEKNNISLNGNLQDLEKNLPLQFSGNFLTLYTGNQMYLSIQNFSLFMGTGNTEAKFFTLLAQQLANKRIALDQQNTIGINIVEIPTYSEILENIFKLYTPFDATFTPILNTKNEFINKISTLPLEYLTTLTTTIQLISNLAGLEISTENLSLNPEKESTTHYKLSEKNKPEYTSALHLTTDSHTFTFVIGYSKEKEMFTL
ncbi:MAG: hypothetical protein LBU27_06975 [Candidatus Peribacteria bacterium]|nr:hypothetical protein [Candidatus Peribacteria bacterium]